MTRLYVNDPPDCINLVILQGAGGGDALCGLQRCLGGGWEMAGLGKVVGCIRAVRGRMWIAEMLVWGVDGRWRGWGRWWGGLGQSGGRRGASDDAAKAVTASCIIHPQLVGPRNCGKTVLLNRFLEAQRECGTLVVHINGRSQKTTDPAVVIERLEQQANLNVQVGWVGKWQHPANPTVQVWP